jgi:hypothetical protein
VNQKKPIAEPSGSGAQSVKFQIPNMPVPDSSQGISYRLCGPGEPPDRSAQACLIYVCERAWPLLVGPRAFAVMQVTALPAACWHDGNIEEAKPIRPGLERQPGRAVMQINLSKVLVLSILGLGMGFAAPASAKSSSHPATSAYASSEHGNDAHPGELHNGRVPEPAYMAIQSRELANGN